MMIPKRAIFIAIALLAIIFFIAEYGSDDSPFPSVPAIEDTTITATYPDLYRDIYTRKTSEILPYTQFRNPPVSKQAWRALVSTPNDIMDQFTNLVRISKHPLAWFALSAHPLTGQQLQMVKSVWSEQPSKRALVSRVLGKQGDEQTLQFLLSALKDSVASPYEYEHALAVSRLMLEHPLAEQQQKKILERAFTVSENPATVRAYLYGFYRSGGQELSPGLKKELYGLWKSYGLGNSDLVDQYIVRLLPEQTLYEITLYYNSEKLLDNKVQLAVELAQNLAEGERTDRRVMAASMLLRHENPHVVRQALISLKGTVQKGDKRYSYITGELLADPGREPAVWLQALETAAGGSAGLIRKHSGRLAALEKSNPHHLEQILRIRQMSESTPAFLERLNTIITNDRPLRSSGALEALGRYWSSLSPEEKRVDTLRSRVRQIVFRALSFGDRSTAFAVAGLLGEGSLFGEEDFSTIKRSLSAFRLPGDIEVYQAFGRVFRERFEQQARPLVDSLASLGYGSLNRSLSQAGWEVEVPQEQAVRLRMPDWETLWKLGRHPVWVLETQKGIVKMKLNTLSAPATVSAIDSLTRSGAYNGVPFHRVIPNFVIQGGDIERGNGLGGPDFVLPTEACEKEFDRGAVGIASAGTDTEGSQYFIMHQWKPHLNGSYTLFGEVAEGMDVVDRIMVGDSVRVAYWQ